MRYLEHAEEPAKNERTTNTSTHASAIEIQLLSERRGAPGKRHGAPENGMVPLRTTWCPWERHGAPVNGIVPLENGFFVPATDSIL